MVHHTGASSQRVRFALTQRLVGAGVDAPVGSNHDPCDDALTESTTGLFKTELIRPEDPLAHRRAHRAQDPASGRLLQHRPTPQGSGRPHGPASRAPAPPIPQNRLDQPVRATNPAPTAWGVCATGTAAEGRRWGACRGLGSSSPTGHRSRTGRARTRGRVSGPQTQGTFGTLRQITDQKVVGPSDVGDVLPGPAPRPDPHRRSLVRRNP